MNPISMVILKKAMKIVFYKTRGLPAVGVAFELLLKELNLEET